MLTKKRGGNRKKERCSRYASLCGGSDLLKMPSSMALFLANGILYRTNDKSSRQWQQTNLVSDISGLAAFTDRYLVNPWGISFSSTSPFWVSDNVTGVSTLYNGKGLPFPPPPASPLVVTIPPVSASGQGTPTGTVFNGTTGFVITQGTSSGPARFLFDTLDGTLSGWNPAVNPSSAIIAVNNAGSASYTGPGHGE